MAQAVVSSGQSVEVLSSTTVTTPNNGTFVLKLHKPKSDKKVQWDEAVVDNEHMGKKKSKCCCIYAKPHKFGESDSESDSEGDGDCCHEHRVARSRVPRQLDPSPPDTQDL